MRHGDPHDWLDRETRSILQPSFPKSATAIAVEGYSLLLIRPGGDRNRLGEFVSELRANHVANLSRIKNVVVQQLTLEEALAAQLTLSCCDCVSAFVSDTIIFDDNAVYLARLCDAVQSSPEFKETEVIIKSMSDDPLARKFCWQFLGMAIGHKFPMTVSVFQKKARLMRHWAARCGVDLE